MLNIANILDFSAKEYMNKTAVILGDKAFTMPKLMPQPTRWLTASRLLVSERTTRW